MKNLKGIWDRSPELLDQLGGEPLSGSGFESEQPDEAFAAQELRAEED